jgi:hypothetical protein
MSSKEKREKKKKKKHPQSGFPQGYLLKLHILVANLVVQGYVV